MINPIDVSNIRGKYIEYKQVEYPDRLLDPIEYLRISAEKETIHDDTEQSLKLIAEKVNEIIKAMHPPTVITETYCDKCMQNLENGSVIYMQGRCPKHN